MGGNCSVIVIAAMRLQLEMVDDDEDGKVDLEEFKEVLQALRSSFDEAAASKLFGELADTTTDEVDIEELMNGMQLTYSLMPAISGDECLKKVAAKRQRQREPPKKEKEKKRVRKVD